jgi:hypothetical protein
MDTQLYRPGPFLAAGILALPVLVPLAVAAIALEQDAKIPVWLPFVLLLWVPCLLVAWRGMLSVRTSAMGIAAGRPWARWREIPWPLVERVEQSLGRMTIHSSDGIQLSFAPVLLRDGGRLKRQMLLRLPGQVLSPALAQEAQTILASGMYTISGGGLAGTLHAHTRTRWRVAVGAVVVVLLAVAATGALLLSPLASIPLAVVCVALAGAAIRLLIWLFQELLVSEKGITAISAITHRAHGMIWTEVELVEHSAAEAMLRLRGTKRITCIGPALLSITERDLLRAFLYEYCVYRSVPVLKRPWLFFR